MAGPLLTRRTSILAALESVYDTLPSFSGTTDAMLMDNPNFTPDFAPLKRNIVQPSMSRHQNLMGRKLGKIAFSCEPNLNGLANTGIAGNAPILARLLRACGLLQTAHNVTWISSVMGLTQPTRAAATMTSSKTGSYAGDPIAYTLTCTTGGGSGTAKVSITPHDLTLDTVQTNVTVTNASAINVGANGAIVTPSAVGTLVIGMQWVVILYPPGLIYTPISTGFESLGLAFYVDGSLNALSGCFGTFSIKADAGQIVKFDFEFTGRYVPYSDTAMPAVTYTAGRPPVFQSAGISVGTYAPIINSLTYTHGNTISERMSANSADGLYGLMITDREPTAGIDPEATAAADHNFWSDFAAAAVVPLFARTSGGTGSKMFFAFPGTQYSGLSYKDRNGVRAHDAAMSLSQILGDDEMGLFLY